MCVGAHVRCMCGNHSGEVVTGAFSEPSVHCDFGGFLWVCALWCVCCVLAGFERSCIRDD